MAKEPTQLRRGKAFHKLIQAEWEDEAQGTVRVERQVVKTGGRKGRIDVFVNDEDPNGTVAIVEIKATDWDKIKTGNIRRNARRQIRQVLGYIESQIRAGKFVPTGEGKHVSPGIIFPRRPRDPRRLRQIETLFWEEGITVVWHDESIEECRVRNKQTSPDC